MSTEGPPQYPRRPTVGDLAAVAIIATLLMVFAVVAACIHQPTLAALVGLAGGGAVTILTNLAHRYLTVPHPVAPHPRALVCQLFALS